jgi:hypothetical protein
VVRLSLRLIAHGWTIGTVLLLGVVASQALAAGSISGKVTGPASLSVFPVTADGTEISGAAARVNATNDKFQVFRTTVDADGNYKLEELEPGTYTVVVVGAGMAPGVKKDVKVTDGEDLKLDVTLEEAQPFPIVRSAGGKPIPLTDDYYSASFADAPEIRLDEPWQLQNTLKPSIELNAWTGPQEMSGKFKFKYSDTALHLAADLNFKTPGVNNWPTVGPEAWNGNHIDLFFQNDAYDPNRAALDLDHDWQVILRLNDEPYFRMLQNGAPTPNQDPPKENASIKDYVLRKVKPDNSGELLRVDYPWAMFQQVASNKGPISAPAENSLGALDISLGAVDPDQPRDEAEVKLRMSWSGFFEGWHRPNQLVPVKFTPQP